MPWCISTSVQDAVTRSHRASSIPASVEAPEIMHVICAFCGRVAERADVIMVNLDREGRERAQQFFLAHPECLADAIKPSGIDLAPNLVLSQAEYERDQALER